MRLFATIGIALFGLSLISPAVLADDDKKEVTLKGSILCARCALKEAKKCQNAIQVKEGDNTVTYYLDDKGMKESYHEPVCGGDKKEGTVVGTVTTRDGKKHVKPTKVEYAK